MSQCEQPPREGVIFYTRPEDLKPEQIDALLRDVVMRINASGWVWTGESCQGHPDAASMADTAWPHNTDPYLRLICRHDDLGRMLASLVDASLPDHEQDEFHSATLRLYRSDVRGEWAEVMVYVQARNVMERDHGCRVLARFAEALHA
jgi:hypothetical protein